MLLNFLEHRKSLNIEKLGKYKILEFSKTQCSNNTCFFSSSNSKYWLISFVFWKYNTAATKPFSCFLTHFEIQVLYRPVIKLAIARTLEDTLSVTPRNTFGLSYKIHTFYMLLICFKYLQKNTWLFCTLGLILDQSLKLKTGLIAYRGKVPITRWFECL